MSKETPVPPGIAIREGLFALGSPPRLLAQRCEQCHRPSFPRAPACPYCGADSVAPIELSGRGVLWAHTAVTAAPPGYEGPVPYGFGVVELAEEIRVVTRLSEADPARLEAGQPMELEVVAVGTDPQGQALLTYSFRALPHG
jgi:uncharacterized OB-fold protein